VWLGCYAGPRIGELLALRWTDVDFLRRTVTVSRKVIAITGAGLVEGATKTKAGRRTVTLPRRIVAELEQHRSAYPSPALVFTSPEGIQVRSGNLRRPGLRRLPWPASTGCTFHDMRHTAVSLWVAAGASDLEVAKWAGHSSAAFTKSPDAHLFPEHGEAPADRLEAFIAASTPTPAASVVHIRRS
jgi:integrase